MKAYGLWYIAASLLWTVSGVCWLAGCSGAGETVRAPAGGQDIDQQAVLQFLKAHVELFVLGAQAYEAVRSGNASGEKALRLKATLDEAAREYGYGSFMEYEQLSVRISNAASFLGLCAEVSEPPAHVSRSDLEAVRPYLEDIRRVEAEARRRTGQK